MLLRQDRLYSGLDTAMEQLGGDIWNALPNAEELNCFSQKASIFKKHHSFSPEKIQPWSGFLLSEVVVWIFQTIAVKRQLYLSKLHRSRSRMERSTPIDGPLQVFRTFKKVCHPLKMKTGGHFFVLIWKPSFIPDIIGTHIFKVRLSLQKHISVTMTSGTMKLLTDSCIY